MALWKKLLLAGAALLAAFTLVGFFVAPPLVKARLLRELSKRLGREVAVGDVAVNPFQLSVTVHDVRIQDRDGKPFASWDRAYANYRFTSFFSKNYVFDELSFVNPYARFVVNEDGTLNIEDLLRIFRASPSAASGPPAVWRFEAVRVSGARVGFTDRQRRPTFESTVGPFELSLERFSTSPHSEAPYGFEGRTESGETFSWKGRVTSNPLKSDGELTLGGVTLPKYRPYYQSGRPFNVREGTVSLKAAYEIVWTDTEKVVRVKGANLALDNAVIGRPGVEEPDIRVASLKVDNANVDALTFETKIERIALEGGRVLLRHDPEHGGVNLHQMLRPFLEGPPSAPATAAAPAGPAAPLSIGTLSVSGMQVDAEDLAPARPFRVSARDVALTVTGIDNKPGTVCPATLTARFGDSGAVKTTGTFSADFHHGDLDVEVDDVDMRATDSYLDPYARVRFARGSVGAKGHVRFELPDRGDMAFSYEGNLRLKDLALVHAETAQDLLRLAVFQIAPLEVRLNPLRVAVGEVGIGAPQLTVGIAPDRSIDLANALVGPAETTAEPMPAPAATPLPHVTIDTVRVQNGSIRVTDRSVEPAVALWLSRLTGTVKGISTDELDRANVDLAAMIDGVAPVAIKGQINPIARKDFTDLTVTAKGIDLLPFSPYSGKYLGYGIGKGKMAADLAYTISERRFTSNNVFTIDQFELGSKVESPDAVHLPVKLAVAVLRDRNGRIVLDVPAQGSVDDPDFRLGKVIVRAIVNVLTKIVTSPFRLLARAFGGKDQNIEYQDFAPGSAELADGERQKLVVVATSLQERPELSLEVHGAVDPVADAAALARARLDRLVRTAKWKVVSATDPAMAAPESVSVGPDEYPRWLKAAYDAAFPPPAPPAAPAKASRRAAGPPPSPPQAPPAADEMESMLAGTITITADDLRALAAERGRAVRDYLTESRGVAAERVFLVEAAAKEGREPASRVWLELK